MKLKVLLEPNQINLIKLFNMKQIDYYVLNKNLQGVPENMIHFKTLIKRSVLLFWKILFHSIVRIVLFAEASKILSQKMGNSAICPIEVY